MANDGDAEGTRPPGRWFDEYGIMCRKLPKECVDEICRSGDNGPAVSKWAEQLNFMDGLDQDLARGHIMESGASSLLEVAKMEDADVARWVLWDISWRVFDEDQEDGVVGMCDSRRFSQFLKERLCMDWGYDNQFYFMRENDPRRIQWEEASAVHKALRARDPGHHSWVVATDTMRGDHCRRCSCGFGYQWYS